MSFPLSLRSSLVTALSVVALPLSATAAEGKIPNRSYPETEVFKRISPQLSNRHMNQPSVINGYAVFAGNAVHEVWDISDPYAPVHLADMVSNHRNGEAESHQVTYARRGDALYMATISGRGIDIWDMTDTPNPELVGEIILPGINYGDVAGAIWGVSWQGDYLFAGATTNGVYVLDVSDPTAPVHVATLPSSAMGGMLAGPLFAIGNLLVITPPKEAVGVATIDISDPRNPRLLDVEIEGALSYIGGFYGTHAYLITPFRAYDVTTDPRNIQRTGQMTVPDSEYMSFGDDKFFLGGLRGNPGTHGIWKYDISNPSQISLEGRYVGRDNRWDDQFSCPVGNLLLVADDQLVNNRYVGGIVVVHSAQPDTAPPRVKYVNPPDGARNQALTTRIGLSLSDWPELTSVDATTLIVRPVGGEPLSGTWSTTTTTLSFAPDEPLEPATTYEIILPAGGITDLVGNPIAAEFRSTFTTVAQGGFPGNDEVNPVPPHELGEPTAFSVKTPDPTREYEWRLDDGTVLNGAAVTHTYSLPGRHVVTMESKPNPESKIEAENATLAGGVTIAREHPGYSGGGYADYPAGTGSNVAIRWSLLSPAPGVYPLTIRYANGGTTNRPLHLVVNGGSPIVVNFPSTGDWPTYQEIVVPTVPLVAGLNNLELRASAGSAGPNIDYFVMTITPEDGETRVSSFMHLVYRALTPLPPSTSQALCLDPENRLVWAVNPDADTITAVDLDSLEKVREVPVGHKPETLALAPDGAIWVANRSSHDISVVNPTTGQTSRFALPYASQPYGLAFAPDGSAAYVALQALGRVVKLDRATRQIVASLDLPSDPDGIRPQVRGVGVTADSAMVLVTRFISPDEGGQVYEIDAATMTLRRTMALAPSDEPDTPTSARGIPNYLLSIGIAPDGKRAWLPSKQDNIFRGTFRDGQALTHDNTVRAVASQIDLESGAEVPGSRLDFDDRDRAHSVTFSPLGDLVFVTMPGNNHVSVHDAYNGREVARIPCGIAPTATLIDSQTRRLFTLDFLSRTLSVHDVRPLLDGGTAFEPLAMVPLVAVEPLAPHVLRGKQLFYDATSTQLNSEHYMSCASCHLDGGHDGRVWDMTSMGEGLRNTIDLRGRAGMGHGRLHWTGNFDEVHDFENQIRFLGRGSGLMTEAQFLHGTRSEPFGNAKAGISEDLDALAAYVESLHEYDPSPFRNPDGTLTADAVAGRRIFNDLRCFDCHGGRNFTDSRLGILHDVGTIKESSGYRAEAFLTGLDTPTLRSVWSGAPYLHDGSASTLRDVLTTANPGDRHGVTSQLSPTEIDQLVAYLQQIDGSEPAANPPSGQGSPLFDRYLADFHLEGSDASETADLDGDSVVTLLEYAHGRTNPTLADSVPQFVSHVASDDDGEWLAYSYLRLRGGHWKNGAYRTADMIYRPQATGDLGDWNVRPTELPNPAGLPPAPGGYEWATFGVPIVDDIPATFLRIHLDRVAPEDL
jgi:Uncharacterized conserved protein